MPPFPKSQKEEGEAGGQSLSQRGLVEGFGVSVGFLFDCCLGRRAEPTGKGTAGTPALVRLPSSARLPPAGECARPPARLCGAAVGGRGERDHLRPEPLPCAGRGSGGSEGREGLGVWCSAPLLPAPRPHPWQPLLQLRFTAAPPLFFLARLCGQGSAVGDSPVK